jgi:antagonist of KipI
MSLRILKPGILSTIQDLGRTGRRSLGINPNGAMDHTAMRLLNILLGNDENEAVLEMHFPAGEFVFGSECSFALAGADFSPTLNDVPIRNWSAIKAIPGDTLKFRERITGMRAYLSIAGGLEIPEWLGSKSTNLTAAAGGLKGRSLNAGDSIEFSTPHNTIKPRALGPSLIPKYSRFPTVRVIAGGEFDLLTAVSERSFLSGAFTLSNDSNRMGFRLGGEPLYVIDEIKMISAGVDFGTIQLLPDGQLIVLMADHQTSGGYPRIAGVITADLPLLAQLGPGDGVGFHLVSIDEAERSLLAFDRDVRFLNTGIRLTL